MTKSLNNNKTGEKEYVEATEGGRNSATKAALLQCDNFRHVLAWDSEGPLCFYVYAIHD